MANSLRSVSDVSNSKVISGTYDLRIFASGFETRCTAVPKRLERRSSGATLVLGFEEHGNNESRKLADKFFNDEMCIVPKIVPTGQPGVIAALIDDKFKGVDEEVRILADISSMSRSWYADLINWARFSDTIERIQIDFCYMGGVYPQPYPPRHISEITSLFGFEGRADLRLETVALMGLGYDPITPHAVLEDLQPELVYGYIASGFNEMTVLNAMRINMATVEELDGPLAVVPLHSVESAYRMIGDMLAPHSGNRNVVLVSLGPKTHVLASLLVAAANEEVACLHVRGKSLDPADVKADGELSACSAVFEKATVESLRLHEELENA